MRMRSRSSSSTGSNFAPPSTSAPSSRRSVSQSSEVIEIDSEDDESKPQSRGPVKLEPDDDDDEIIFVGMKRYVCCLCLSYQSVTYTEVVPRGLVCSMLG